MSEEETSYERRRRERAERRKAQAAEAEEDGGDSDLDSIQRRRKEREARRKAREEASEAEASDTAGGGEEEEDSAARRARERRERRQKLLEEEDAKAAALTAPAEKRLGGRTDKGDDDSDDSHEEDFNPNLQVDDVDLSSDEDESEETRRRKAEQRKLDRAKDAASLKESQGNIFERMDADASESFTVQGAAVISALAGGKSKDLSKYIRNDSDDEDDDEERDDGKQYMVNPLLFGREDQSDEYGAIFGKDLEWFPEGLRVWKMERFLPKPVAVNLYGKFLTRETYLVLNIEDNDDGSKNATISYWLGSETTMDKSGGAAFRIGELAGYLAAMSRANEIPCKFRQSRVEEGEEPDEFRDLFDPTETEYGGFHIEEGGTLSEFNKVDLDHGPPCLYRVAADGHTHEMGLDADCLNRKHAFLLDEGKVIWVWHGCNATYFDRFKAVELASKLANKERMGRSRVEQVEDDAAEGQNPTVDFWKHFGLVRPPHSIRDEFIAYETPKYRIWRTQNVDGKFDLIEITERPLAKSMLNTKHCIIFDAFYTIYNWKGTRSSPLERAASELLAQKFLTEMTERPEWARIKNVLESAEPELFKEKFGDWKDDLVEETNFNHVADSAPPPTIDVQTLLEDAYWEPNLLDDASGTIEAWVITGAGPKFDKLTERERGTFWSGSCYMVLYSYTAEDEDGDPEQRYRVYFWEGAQAGVQWYPQFMFGFFPVLERKIKAQGRHVDQVHIHQGSEPKHFCMLFNSLLIVRNGKRQEPADEDESPREWEEAPLMLDVRLQMPSETVRAIEPQHISAAFLHSDSTFLLVTPRQTFLWLGKASRLFPSNDAMKSLVNRVGRGATVPLMEGDDEEEAMADFWEALGGPGPYCKKDRRSHWLPRMFEAYAHDGQLKMREVVNFSQWDLAEQGAFLVDCYDKLYVWYGSLCSETMKQSAILVANTYIRLAATVREMYVGLEVFASRTEPLEFQWVFHTWRSQGISSEAKAYERRALRLHRMELLEYRRVQAEERAARRKRIAQQFMNENRIISENNEKMREGDADIERHNQKLEASKLEDAKFEQAKLERERARKEKEEAFKREMEEMEAERERKRKERESRRKREEAGEPEPEEAEEKKEDPEPEPEAVPEAPPAPEAEAGEEEE